ncbi:MAG: glycosyltransferase family 10 [Burkholderiaceae bacterium]
MPKSIRIATSGVAEDYRHSLVPLIFQNLGYRIEWTLVGKADLVIFGPFFKPGQELRWVPRSLRPAVQAWNRRMQSSHRPLTLFQTAENLRHDHIPCDYALSFDLAVEAARHRRFPYWLEMVDWQHEDIYGNRNPRFGRLLNLDRLAQPLGKAFLQKAHRAAIFASHLREPRATLVRAVGQLLPVQGFGPIFDPTIMHHSQSDFTKLNVLRDFAFNLCPENSIYPGYYTEKIPEAFMADCLPLTWTDGNVAVDFNPQAILNLAPMTAHEFRELSGELLDPVRLARFAEQPLLLHKPTLQPVTDLLQHIAAEACS